MKKPAKKPRGQVILHVEWRDVSITIRGGDGKGGDITMRERYKNAGIATRIAQITARRLGLRRQRTDRLGTQWMRFVR